MRVQKIFLAKTLTSHYRQLLLTVLMLGAAAGTAVADEECHQMACTIIGTDQRDVLIGTEGRDVICGLKGNDTIYGNGGDDLICGDEDHDNIFGGSGNDILVGGHGKDLLAGDQGDDELYGNQGKDTLEGGDNNDYLQGDQGKDRIDGGAGNDICAVDKDKTLQNCEHDSANSGTEKNGSDVTTFMSNSVSSFTKAMEENGSGFTTLGNQIYDPDGNPFTARGVNIFPWHGGPSSIDKITGCWGFNLVRLHAWILPYDTGHWKDHVVYVEDPVFYNPELISYRVYDVAGLIEAYTSQGIVVVFDVHDKIGRYFEGQEMSDYLTFITHFADKYKDNPYVWLDIHNEPGTYDGINQDFTKWRTEMSTILDTVRAIAPDMLMLVSGTAWGQDTGPNWNSQFIQPQQSALLANADIINSYDNVIATFHMYDQWVYGGLPRLADFVDQLNMTLDKPVIVGEYGSYNNRDTVIASANLHNLTSVSGYENIGRIVWNWNGRDLNDLTTSDYGGGEHVDSCTTPTNLTALGNLVWDDNHM